MSVHETVLCKKRISFTSSDETRVLDYVSIQKGVPNIDRKLREVCAYGIELGIRPNRFFEIVTLSTISRARELNRFNTLENGLVL